MLDKIGFFVFFQKKIDSTSNQVKTYQMLSWNDSILSDKVFVTCHQVFFGVYLWYLNIVDAVLIFIEFNYQF
jgi:hypothetical protein